MRLKRYLLILVGSLVIYPAFAQKTRDISPKSNASGYSIQVKLKQASQDTMFYLAGFFGEKKIKIDSVKVSKKNANQFVFKSDSILESGIYLVLNQQRKEIFEFIVEKSQHISVELDPKNVAKTIRIKNSPETTLFYDYMRTIMAKQDSVKELEGVLDYAEKTNNVMLFNQKHQEYLRMIKQTDAFTADFIDNHPANLMAKVLKMNKEIVVPPLPTRPDGVKDSTWGWVYYKSHYWDYVDLKDERMIRTPIFGKKMATYFEEVIYQHPDSLIAEIDAFLQKTKSSKAMFKYALTWFTVRYRESAVVGHDAVFVHLVERYYMTNEVDWLSENMIRILTKRAAQLKSILIGSKIPELIMADTSGVLRSSYNTGSKYTILWFWDPDCAHCVVETPKLLEFYQQNKVLYDVEVYAVSLNRDLEPLKKYIRENKLSWINVGGDKANVDYTMVFDVVATPMIYVVDGFKRIIAKNIPIENIKDIILRYEELTKRK